jgi:hypothetical protein
MRGSPIANTSASRPAAMSATGRATCARLPVVTDAPDADSHRHLIDMRRSFLLMVLLFATSVAACAPQQPYVVAPQISDKTADAHPIAARALPYKGRLVEGDPTELPPAIARALSNDAPLTFSYREELTHDEYHIPMMLSAIDPATYVGTPLGDYGVTAFATLTIFEGNQVIGDYTAKAHVSKSYNLYFEPKHSELERAAREAVRDRIDQKLYEDADRVSRAVANSSPAIGQ